MDRKACFLLVAFFLFMAQGRALAVVPDPLSLATKAPEQAATQKQLTAIIEKLEDQEQRNIEFLKSIRAELVQLKQKEGGL